MSACAANAKRLWFSWELLNIYDDLIPSDKLNNRHAQMCLKTRSESTDDVDVVI